MFQTQNCVKHLIILYICHFEEFLTDWREHCWHNICFLIETYTWSIYIHLYTPCILYRHTWVYVYIYNISCCLQVGYWVCSHSQVSSSKSVYNGIGSRVVWMIRLQWGLACRLQCLPTAGGSHSIIKHHQALVQCWASVYDAGPTLSQRLPSLLYLICTSSLFSYVSNRQYLLPHVMLV